MGLDRSRNYEFVGKNGVRNGAITKRETQILIMQPSMTSPSRLRVAAALALGAAAFFFCLPLTMFFFLLDAIKRT